MCFVLGKSVCKMIPNTSFCLLCCMVYELHGLFCITLFMFFVWNVQCFCWNGLFVLKYLVCSRRRISVDFLVWPKYDLLHVLHFNLCMPLDFILFSGILSRSLLYIMLIVRKAIFKFVFLNKFVTLCMSGLWYILTTPTRRQHQHTVSPSYTKIQLLCLHLINP